MKNSYIKEFIVLADVGNFLEAADILFISQSSLSRHIKSIESELGVSLFDRTTRKVTLSEAGKIFLPYAKKISKLQDDYEKELKNQINKNHYSITVGSIPVLINYHITDIFVKFQKENSNFSLNILEGDTNELLNMVINKKCDFAFIRVSEDKSILQDFNHIYFAKDHLGAFIPKTHYLSNKTDSIHLSQLKDENFLLLKSNTMMYKLCLEACDNAGFTPNIIYTGSRSSNIIDLVKKGMGIALLMKNAASQNSLTDICVLDIEPEINTHIYLIYNKSHKMNIASKHFIELIKKTSLNQTEDKIN